jgi:hypothetical protein
MRLFVALIELTGLGLLIRWRPRMQRISSCPMVIVAFYVFFLMYGVNYRTYLYYGVSWFSTVGATFSVLNSIRSLPYLLRLFVASTSG